MRRLAGAVLLAGTLAAASPALAGHTPGASFPTLRSDAVKRLLDVREPVVLVDMRKPAEYKAGHLPGAISLPITELERRYREIPKGPRVILYCGCWRRWGASTPFSPASAGRTTSCSRMASTAGTRASSPS
jgi:hypothetical protein